MFIEVAYQEQLGSVCPFCGTAFTADTTRKLDYVKTDKIRESVLWWSDCQFCALPSVVLSLMVTDETKEYGYSFSTRQFMFKQDYEDYFDVTVTEGPYAIPLYHEDDILGVPEIKLRPQKFTAMKEGLSYGQLKQPYAYRLYTIGHGQKTEWFKVWGSNRKSTHSRTKGERPFKGVYERGVCFSGKKAGSGTKSKG